MEFCIHKGASTAGKNDRHPTKCKSQTLIFFHSFYKHKINFATVHSQVIVGGCSVDYEYNFLATSVYYDGRRNGVLFMRPKALTAGPPEVFLLISRNRTEQQWLKGYWILGKWVPSNFTNKLCTFQLYAPLPPSWAMLGNEGQLLKKNVTGVCGYARFL